MGHRGLTVAAAATVLAVCVAVARPLRYEVEGLSMAPGLLPGDTVSTGWFPGLERRRSPGRFERWIVTVPGGGAGIKRVAGLPGEVISIENGDLAVAGTTVLSNPETLAGRGTRLDDLPEGAGTVDAEGFQWRHVAAAAPVLDDAAFAPGERRLLLPE
ncbi:MAG: S26 family signal peptidase [Planctomycetia bacterium]